MRSLAAARTAGASPWSPAGGDVGMLVLSLLLLGALVTTAELLHRRLAWPSRHSRRLVHAATGLYVVAIPYLFSSATPVYLLAAGFVVVNGVTAARGWLRGMHPEGPPSWGTMAFPLALLVLLPFCWGEETTFVLQSAFLVLAVADPVAAAVGERWPRGRVRVGCASKTITGSLAFLAAASLLTFAALRLFGSTGAGAEPVLSVALVALLVGVLTTAVEALGGRGWDNFFIPVVTAVVLLLWRMHPDWLPAMGFAAAIGIGFGVLAWKLEFLTLSGAIAGGLFAATLIGIGGWGWVAPGLAFFFLSSTLSKLSARLRGMEGDDEARESRRDATQVYANGGIAWLLVVMHAFVPEVRIYWAFLGGLAAATADTWATEVGPLFRQQPRMIVSGRRVPPGTSGGVTWAGTLAGVVGALVVWAVAWWSAPEAARGVGAAASAAAVIGGGVVGSLADSLAGATIQEVYRDSASGRLVDGRVRGGARLERVRGWRGIDNDAVNVLCTVAGAAASALVLML